MAMARSIRPYSPMARFHHSSSARAKLPAQRPINIPLNIQLPSPMHNHNPIHPWRIQILPPTFPKLTTDRQNSHNTLHNLPQRKRNLPLPHSSIETDGTNRSCNLDNSFFAFREPVRARCVGPWVAEEAIDGRLAGAEANGVDGARIGKDATDLIV